MIAGSVFGSYYLRHAPSLITCAKLPPGRLQPTGASSCDGTSGLDAANQAIGVSDPR